MSEAEKQAAAILDKMYARGMNAKEFAAEIAAAEERGRRRGVEEAEELRAALRTYRRHHPCDYCETKHPPVSLAPRDSGPKPKQTCPACGDERHPGTSCLDGNRK